MRLLLPATASPLVSNCISSCQQLRLLLTAMRLLLPATLSPLASNYVSSCQQLQLLLPATMSPLDSIASPFASDSISSSQRQLSSYQWLLPLWSGTTMWTAKCFLNIGSNLKIQFSGWTWNKSHQWGEWGLHTELLKQFWVKSLHFWAVLGC